MQDGTKVILPDRAYLTKLYLNTLLVFLAFVLPWILLGLVPELGQTYVIIFLVVNVVWMVPTFALLLPRYYQSIRYELREDEIVVVKGIVTRSVKVIPYRAITNLHLARGPVDRLLGLGTLKVQTAGLGGQSGPEAALSGLRDYDAVYELIREALRRYRWTTGAITTEPAPATDQGEMLRQLLQEVREIKELIRSR